MSRRDATASAALAADSLGWAPRRLVMATGFRRRLLGMIALSPFGPDGAPTVLVLPRCAAIHTCFMRFPLDIAFADGEGGVLAVHGGVVPWRFLMAPGAEMVLERASLDQAGTGALPSRFLPMAPCANAISAAVPEGSLPLSSVGRGPCLPTGCCPLHSVVLLPAPSDGSRDVPSARQEFPKLLP